MKILGYLAVILAMLAISSLFFLYGFYESKIAAAHEKFSVLDFGGADAVYQELENYLNQAKWVPKVLEGFKKELKNKRMDVRYWQGDYSGLISEIHNFENNGLRNWKPKFVLGNSLYRSVTGEKDRKKVSDTLGSAVFSYASAVAENPDHFDSAFNYEYLSRVKKEVELQKKPLPLDKNQPGQKKKSGKSGNNQQEGSGQKNERIFGEEGFQQEGAGKDKIKIFVPLQPDEKEGEKTSKEGEGVGKGKVKRGKG